MKVKSNKAFVINIKEVMMNKVKTVVDAINCHRGRVPIQRGLMFVSTYDNGALIDKSSCTKLQFNQLVEDMSHHAGIELFNEYVKADKKLLEKESKVDHTSREFWKDAPEGKNYLITYKSGVVAQVYNYFSAKPKIIDGYYRIAGESVGYGTSSWEVFERPKPQPKESNMKPVFTQAMSDNGELPPIGSKCLVIGEKEIDDEYHECEIIAHRNVSGDVFVAVFMIKNYNGKPYYYTHCSHQYFKPIDTRTDKEKAIDEIRLSCGFNKLVTMESDLLSKAYDKWVGK